MPKPSMVCTSSEQANRPSAFNPDETPSLLHTVSYAVQHVLTMLPATVAVPLLIVSELGEVPADAKTLPPGVPAAFSLIARREGDVWRVLAYAAR